jgi:predicted O-methyltransferase YrrM
MQAIIERAQRVCDFLDHEERFADVEGFLLAVEGCTLMELAARGPGVGEIVEIGSYMGRSTCFLAAGAMRMHRERVTAVDHFAGSPEHQKGAFVQSEAIVQEGTTLNRFKVNIEAKGVSKHVEPVVADSATAAGTWEKPIRLLFIDGDHSYEASKADFEAWAPYVVPGGCICFHDINGWPGVTRFLRELLDSSPEFELAILVQSLAVVIRKPSPEHGAEQSLKTLFASLEPIYDYVNGSSALAGVLGRLHPVEGYVLKLLAAEGPGIGAIVELGSGTGLATCYLARGAQTMRREKVTAVDTFDGTSLPEFKDEAGGSMAEVYLRNIAAAKVADHIETVMKPPESAFDGWDGPIRLLFIDGDHSYEATKAKFEGWTRHIVPGGIIALHEATNQAGVAKLLKEVLAAENTCEFVLSVNSMVVLQKKV